MHPAAHTHRVRASRASACAPCVYRLFGRSGERRVCPGAPSHRLRRARARTATPQRRSERGFGGGTPTPCEGGCVPLAHTRPRRIPLRDVKRRLRRLTRRLVSRAQGSLQQPGHGDSCERLRRAVGVDRFGAHDASCTRSPTRSHVTRSLMHPAAHACTLVCLCPTRSHASPPHTPHNTYDGAPTNDASPRLARAGSPPQPDRVDSFERLQRAVELDYFVRTATRRAHRSTTHSHATKRQPQRARL